MMRNTPQYIIPNLHGISIAVTGTPSKKTFLNKLGQFQSRRKTNYRPTAIFASSEFTKWLEDEQFMSDFFRCLAKASLTEPTPKYGSLNVLLGVIDGLGPKTRFGEARRGFSILSGHRKLLPGFTERDENHNTVGGPDRAASVSFLEHYADMKSEITLPLANTVFQNGRRSTLLATQWKRDSNGSYQLSSMWEKLHQRIYPWSSQTAGHSVPLEIQRRYAQINPLGPGDSQATKLDRNFLLLPLCPPRKIIAGLGNIVRQVEIDGVASPASKELEAVISQLFDQRCAGNPATTLDPIGVWAWVIPPELAAFGILSDLEFFQNPTVPGQSERWLAKEAETVFSELSKFGCRVHKILSGGGGWGLKQGLLSLDPEISYSAPEQDDIEMFIKAFEERDTDDQSSGLVTPGSYLLFCTQPAGTEIEYDYLLNYKFTLGVAPKMEEHVQRMEGDEGEVEVVEDEFSAVSVSGLFVSEQEKHSSGSEGEKDNWTERFRSKVDVPNTLFHQR